MAAYTLFHLGQALAPNIQTMLVTRLISGFAASAPLVNCGGKYSSITDNYWDAELFTGIIADIWDAGGRGPATSLFVACVFLGPVMGKPASHGPTAVGLLMV